MPKITGYKDNGNGKLKNTSFTRKWGISAWELAKQDDVNTATIHMRVHNFGSPFQRSQKPTICEELCGKTTVELSEELNLHPISIEQRVRKYANPYKSAKDIKKEVAEFKPFHGRRKSWLMEEHPCYAEWKKERQIDDAFLKIQAGYEE